MCGNDPLPKETAHLLRGKSGSEGRGEGPPRVDLAQGAILSEQASDQALITSALSDKDLQYPRIRPGGALPSVHVGIGI
jgi:hypothetical protein